jgi:hypothetical protein
MKNLELNRLFNEQIDVFSIFMHELKQDKIDNLTLIRVQRKIRSKGLEIINFIDNANNNSKIK